MLWSLADLKYLNNSWQLLLFLIKLFPHPLFPLISFIWNPASRLYPGLPALTWVSLPPDNKITKFYHHYQHGGGNLELNKWKISTKLQNFTTANVEGKISNSTKLQKFTTTTNVDRNLQVYIWTSKNLYNIAIEGESQEQPTTNLQKELHDKMLQHWL